METTEKRVRELLARQDILDCLARYARGVDRLDEQLIRSAFWPDAHDSHGEIDGDVDHFIATWTPGQRGREVCQHNLMNHVVEINGDDAHAETYFFVASKFADRPTLELVGGRYLDRLQCRGGEWRIHERLVLLEWQTVTDAGGMADRLARRHQGSRDHLDPSYERPLHPRSAL